MKKVTGFWMGILVLSVAMISLFIYIISVRHPLDVLLEKNQVSADNIVYQTSVKGKDLLFVAVPDATFYFLVDENIFGYKLIDKGHIAQSQNLNEWGFSYDLLRHQDSGGQTLIMGYVSNPLIKEIQYQPPHSGIKVKVNQSYYVIKLGKEEPEDYQLIGLDEGGQAIEKVFIQGEQVSHWLKSEDLDDQVQFEDGIDFESADEDGDLEDKTDLNETQAFMPDILSQMEEGVCYEFYGFIDAYDLTEKTLEVNEISWIEDRAIAERLNLDLQQLEQSGFVISDLDPHLYHLELADDVKYTMLNESTEMTVQGSAIWEFIDYMKEDNFNYPFTFKILNGKVYEINQVYLP